jgi:hypothetical protein
MLAEAKLDDPRVGPLFKQPSSVADESSIFAGKPHTLSTRSQSSRSASGSAAHYSPPQNSADSPPRPVVLVSNGQGHPALRRQKPETQGQHLVHAGYQNGNTNADSNMDSIALTHPGDMGPPPLPPATLSGSSSLSSNSMMRPELSRLDTRPHQSHTVEYSSLPSSQSSLMSTPPHQHDNSNFYQPNTAGQDQGYYKSHPQIGSADHRYDHSASSSLSPESNHITSSPPLYNGMPENSTPQAPYLHPTMRRPSIVEIQYPHPVNMGYPVQYEDSTGAIPGQEQYYQQNSHLEPQPVDYVHSSSNGTSFPSTHNQRHTEHQTPSLSQHYEHYRPTGMPAPYQDPEMQRRYAEEQERIARQQHQYQLSQQQQLENGGYSGETMGGLAATDQELQATWTAFMYQVNAVLVCLFFLRS